MFGDWFVGGGAWVDGVFDIVGWFGCFVAGVFDFVGTWFDCFGDGDDAAFLFGLDVLFVFGACLGICGLAVGFLWSRNYVQLHLDFFQRRNKVYRWPNI